MAVPTFLIFLRLDYYSTLVLYNAFCEYFDEQSLPTQPAEVGAMAQQCRHF
jgi:hypothetical protein